MSLRTDLAVESLSNVSKNKQLDGASVTVEQIPQADLEITKVKVTTQAAADKLSKPIGDYITVKFLTPIEEFSDKFEERVNVLSEQINALHSGAERILTVGLGNRAITPDAIGPLCADRIFATRHIKKYASEIDSGEFKDVSSVQTGVMGDTGIEASEQIKALCGTLSPDLVVAVDALACYDPENLGRTIQLCNTGISPGSGVENARAELSKRTLGVTCIAAGVPTVADLSSLTENAHEKAKQMMVTPRNIDRLAEASAKYIAYALNKSFLPNLSLEDIQSLVE